jgi:hypothetical protein
VLKQGVSQDASGKEMYIVKDDIEIVGETFIDLMEQHVGTSLDIKRIQLAVAENGFEIGAGKLRISFLEIEENGGQHAEGIGIFGPDLVPYMVEPVICQELGDQDGLSLAGLCFNDDGLVGNKCIVQPCGEESSPEQRP